MYSKLIPCQMNPIPSEKYVYLHINFNNAILQKLGLFPLRIPNKILYEFLMYLSSSFS